MIARKVALTVVILAWLGLLVAGLGVQFSLAHHFGHAWQGKESALPQLTRVALHVLGNAQLEGSHHPAHWIANLLLFAGPLALLVFVWRATDRLALVELVVFGGGTYLILALAFVGLVLFGLWLPSLSL